MLIEVCLTYNLQHLEPIMCGIMRGKLTLPSPDRVQPDHMLPSIISGTAAERTKVVMKMFFQGVAYAYYEPTYL